MLVLEVLTFVILVFYACICTGAVIVFRDRVAQEAELHDAEVEAAKRVAEAELESYKRVGRWFEKRVDELEQETTALAAQVIAAGTVPVPQFAMPPVHEEYHEYATDDTGLIVFEVEPSDSL